mgnify:CR=1 FL=1
MLEKIPDEIYLVGYTITIKVFFYVYNATLLWILPILRVPLAGVARPYFIVLLLVWKFELPMFLCFYATFIYNINQFEICCNFQVIL